MAGGQSQLGFGGCVGTKSIGDHSFWREALLLEQLSQEFDGRTCVAPPLDEKVKGLALVVDRAPKPEMPARDRNHHLVEMPA